MCQALEALEAHADIGIKCDKVITALRTAIEQAESVEPVATYTCGVCGVSMRMESAAAQQEPVAWIHRKHYLLGHAENMPPADKALAQGWEPLYTTPPAAPVQEPVAWTEREKELIDGMIEVQLDHARRCDNIVNRTMADKQKGWDMERVALLQKIRATPPAAQQEPVTETQKRAAFERFWVAEIGDKDDLTYGGLGYAIHRVAVAWEAWKAAAQRQPLTDEQINTLRQQYGVTSDGRGIKEFTYVLDFARAIEAAHGIKEKNT
jgi:hypothetical protein